MVDRSITCPRCGATSFHPGDIEHGYCGRCHWWTSDPAGVLNQPWVIAQAEREGALDVPKEFADRVVIDHDRVERITVVSAARRRQQHRRVFVCVLVGVLCAGLWGLGQDLGLYDVAGIADLVVTIVAGYGGMFAAALWFDRQDRRR